MRKCFFLFLLLGSLLLPENMIAQRVAVSVVEKGSIIDLVNGYLHKLPVIITEAKNERSTGCPHDFYSEDDEWCPIQRIQTDPIPEGMV